MFIIYIISDDMAESATRHNNYRSGNEQSNSLPVHLQFSDDSQFLSDLVSNRTTKIGQVSDSESSISGSDCEDLISSPSHVSKKQVKFNHPNLIRNGLVHRVIMYHNMTLMSRY